MWRRTRCVDGQFVGVALTNNSRLAVTLCVSDSRQLQSATGMDDGRYKVQVELDAHEGLH